MLKRNSTTIADLSGVVSTPLVVRSVLVGSLSRLLCELESLIVVDFGTIAVLMSASWATVLLSRPRITRICRALPTTSNLNNGLPTTTTKNAMPLGSIIEDFSCTFLLFSAVHHGILCLSVFWTTWHSQPRGSMITVDIVVFHCRRHNRYFVIDH